MIGANESYLNSLSIKNSFMKEQVFYRKSNSLEIFGASKHFGFSQYSIVKLVFNLHFRHASIKDKNFCTIRWVFLYIYIFVQSYWIEKSFQGSQHVTSKCAADIKQVYAHCAVSSRTGWGYFSFFVVIITFDICYEICYQFISSYQFRNFNY